MKPTSSLFAAALVVVVMTTTMTTVTVAFSTSNAWRRTAVARPRSARSGTTTTMLGWSPLGVLRSPAGKVTLSTEVSSRGSAAVSSEDVEEVSKLCRQYAKAAVVVVRDAPLVAGVVKEQQTVMGDFPGPCPVVYRPKPSPLESGEATVQTAVLHGATAVAVEVPMAGDSSDSLATLEALATSAKTLGVTVIPELTLEADVEIGEEEASERVRAAAAAAGGCKFAFLGGAAATGSLAPSISKEARKEVGVVGVVDLPPNQDVLKATIKNFEQRGLAGAIVGTECVPQHLDVVQSGKYFAAALMNLRSTASESFRVRLKAFDKEGSGAPSEWQKYYQMVEDTGITGKDQLAGDDGDNLITPGMKGEQVDEKSDKDRKFDPEQGDYKGFA